MIESVEWVRKMADDGIPEEFRTEEGIRTLAKFLRGDNGIKVRTAVEHEKRVDYFKGKRFLDLILEGHKSWPKTLPRVEDKATATLIAQELIKANMFHRSEKVMGKKGVLQISQRNVFEENGIYTWMYTGSMLWSNLATGAVIFIVIGFTLLPIWPDIMKKILWYISVTFLLFTFTFVSIRFIIFLISWVLGQEFWIFPRLFDESLSFQDSFKPIYSIEKVTSGQGYYRIVMLSVIVYFAYWAYSQPTEFDAFLGAQKDFVDDLYSGNLLADVAQEAKMNIDRTKGRVPDLEDLLRQVKKDELGQGDDEEDNEGGANGGDTEEETKDREAAEAAREIREEEILSRGEL